MIFLHFVLKIFIFTKNSQKQGLFDGVAESHISTKNGGCLAGKTETKMEIIFPQKNRQTKRDGSDKLSSLSYTIKPQMLGQIIYFCK